MIRIDPEDLFIPAIGSVPFRWDPRGEDRSTFAQSDAEKRNALNLKPRSDFDDKTETLFVHFYNGSFQVGTVNAAIGHFRDEGKTVRRVVCYMHPDKFRDQFLELQYHKFERNESLEGQGGYFAFSRTLRPRAKKTEANVEAQKGEASTL